MKNPQILKADIGCFTPKKDDVSAIFAAEGFSYMIEIKTPDNCPLRGSNIEYEDSLIITEKTIIPETPRKVTGIWTELCGECLAKNCPLHTVAYNVLGS